MHCRALPWDIWETDTPGQCIAGASKPTSDVPDVVGDDVTVGVGVVVGDAVIL